MTARMDFHVQPATKENPTVVITVDTGHGTHTMVVGEGQTELEARTKAIQQLRMACVLLSSAVPNKNGWLGTVSDGWTMSTDGQAG